VACGAASSVNSQDFGCGIELLTRENHHEQHITIIRQAKVDSRLDVAAEDHHLAIPGSLAFSVQTLDLVLDQSRAA
jgi:hypothetical protein